MATRSSNSEGRGIQAGMVSSMSCVTSLMFAGVKASADGSEVEGLFQERFGVPLRPRYVDEVATVDVDGARVAAQRVVDRRLSCRPRVARRPLGAAPYPQKGQPCLRCVDRTCCFPALRTGRSQPTSGGCVGTASCPEATRRSVLSTSTTRARSQATPMLAFPPRQDARSREWHVREPP